MVATTKANELVTANMDIAEKLAGKFARKSPGQYEDLLQEAYLALVKAANSPHFDPSKGDFAGYGWRAVENRLRNVVSRHRSVKAQSLTCDEGTVDVADTRSEEVVLDPRDVEQVKRQLGTLDSKERRAVELAYGLRGKGGMGPDEVCQEMRLNSRQAAAKVTSRGTGKLVRSMYPEAADEERESDRAENVRLALLRLGLVAALLATARRRRSA